MRAKLYALWKRHKPLILVDGICLLVILLSLIILPGVVKCDRCHKDAGNYYFVHRAVVEPESGETVETTEKICSRCYSANSSAILSSEIKVVKHRTNLLATILVLIALSIALFYSIFYYFASQNQEISDFGDKIKFTVFQRLFGGKHGIQPQQNDPEE